MPDTRDDDITAAYAAGQPVAAIAALYGLTAAEVERIATGLPPAPPVRRLGLHSAGNRVLLGVAVGFVVQVFAGLLGATFAAQLVVWVVVAAITYAVATPRQ